MNLTTENSYLELGTRMKDLKEQIKALEDAVKPLKKEYEELTRTIIPQKLEQEGLSTVNIKGLGRITVTQQMSVSVLKDNQALLRKWMRDHGYGELVVETINSSTLKAWLKERIEAADDYPADLLNIFAYEQASLTKK